MEMQNERQEKKIFTQLNFATLNMRRRGKENKKQIGQLLWDDYNVFKYIVLDTWDVY